MQIVFVEACPTYITGIGVRWNEYLVGPGNYTYDENILVFETLKRWIKQFNACLPTYRPKIPEKWIKAWMALS